MRPEIREEIRELRAEARRYDRRAKAWEAAGQDPGPLKRMAARRRAEAQHLEDCSPAIGDDLFR